VLDLAAWADERYRIPGEPIPHDDFPGDPDDETPRPRRQER
jgi:endogenous inhibitor of DNA gyrase (YacG/DUF329 family)